MQIKQIQGRCIATIKQEKKDYLNYGNCPECNKKLEKKIYMGSNQFWGRLFCPKCNWIGFQGTLESVELDPIKKLFTDKKK